MAAKRATAPKTRQQTKAARSPKRTAKRKYEGASKSKRLSRWKTESTSANSETQVGLVTLRDRARDLRRNDGYAANGVTAISSHIVGDGISTQFREAGDLVRLEAEWKAWAETPAIDFDGRHNIYGLQTLVTEALVESGEVLIRKRFNALMRFPLQYQILEADFLDTTKSQAKTTDGNTIIQGIEFDSQGRRVAYWIYESHPGGYDQVFFNSTLKSNRVPVDEVHHVYRMDRPGQARGITWFAPVIVKLKDFDDYEDAQLLRQKIAACFTAFVRDLSPETADDFDSTEQSETVSDAEKIEPAMIEHLPNGKTIEFANPPVVQNYGEYTSTVLHRIASGLGITYEVLTNDYSRVNFSSGRMGWLTMHRNIKRWRENIIYTHALNPIAVDFLSVATVMGINTKGTAFVHVAPKIEMIDPTKEIPATIEAIRGGLMTPSDAILAEGKDPVVHFEQYAKDIAMLDKLKLKITSDARLDISVKGKKITDKTEEGNANAETTEN
jgi:lambda family phage portal protein